jgi:hypothetical protein
MSSLKTTNILNPSSTTNNIVLAADGSTTISTLTATTIQGTIKSGTAVASTSGTSIDFTGIPSWVKRITVMFSGVSTNGTSNVQIQLGDSGGMETTGYVSTSSGMVNASNYTPQSSTAGYVIGHFNAADITSGHMLITKIDGNSYVSSHTVKNDTNIVIYGGGNKTLSDTLTQLRITTVNGTDTFDAGTINILYEG